MAAERLWRPRAATLVAAALLLLATGCGGGTKLATRRPDGLAVEGPTSGSAF